MNKIVIFLICFILGFHAPILSSSEPDGRINEILEFWFGPLKDSEEYKEDRSDLWFNTHENFDSEIRTRYETLTLAASQKKLDFWKETPRGRLALILLVDQFPRNIYRNSPQAYAFDAMAQEITIEGISSGDDQRLRRMERCFFYLPLEHAENLQLQELSVEKFEDLVKSAPKSLQAHYQSYADYAQHHYKIVLQFGRFPHRNKILGRDSTAEEMKFLE